MKWELVAAALGRELHSCATAYSRWIRKTTAGDRQPLAGNLRDLPEISDHVKEQRDLRISSRIDRDARAFARGDLTPAFFGDPPPGYSALDKIHGRTP
jgi:hypothetical protein